MSLPRVEGRVIVSPGPVHPFPALRENLPPLHHRSDAFRNLVTDIEKMLDELAGSSSPVYLLAASGTGAMEAAVANMTVPGSRVFVVSGGKFGRRWSEICGAYGCRVETAQFDGGKAVDVDAVLRGIRETGAGYVTLTHVESTTGLLAPVREIASRLESPRPVVIVDGISSLGAEEFSMNRWGVDVLVGASQKSFAAPPGVSFVVMGERARPLAGRRGGSYYFDFARFEAGRKRGDTPFTPAIETIQIMHRSLSMMRRAGFGVFVRRHARAAAAMSAAAERCSLRPYSECPSSAVQVFRLPEGCRADEVLARLEGRGFVAAGGQDEVKGKVVRLGFLGLFDVETLARLARALAMSLGESGVRVDVSGAERCIRDGGIDAPPDGGNGEPFSGLGA